jgi:hypothetical protein
MIFSQIPSSQGHNEQLFNGLLLLQDQQFLEQINELQRKVQLVARSIFIVIIVGEQPLIYL